MKHLKYLLILVAAVTTLASCNDFLDTEPADVLTEQATFSSETLIKSVLVNLYRRTERWDFLIENQNRGDSFIVPDEAAVDDGRRNWPNIPIDMFQLRDDAGGNRADNYEFVRECNLFLQNLQKAVDNKWVDWKDQDPDQLKGEVMMLRAYFYFVAARNYGGMVLVGDQTWEYEAGMTQDEMQAWALPRSTESATWQYIIDQCVAAAALMTNEMQPNASRCNAWAAKALAAKAALYAGSIAQHTEAMGAGAANYRTAGWEAGIQATEAVGFYQQCVDLCDDILANGPYSLKRAATLLPADLSRNFYEVSVAKGGTEAIWALDRYYPGFTTGYTNSNVPYSHKEDMDASDRMPVFNLVEEFEDVTTGLRRTNATMAMGDLVAKIGPAANPTRYNNPLDLFTNIDPRLAGSVILPYASYTQGGNSGPVEIQRGVFFPARDPGAGGISFTDNRWDGRNGEALVVDGIRYTSENGPYYGSTENNRNKTGFHLRKFMDESSAASSRGVNSTMWNLRIRLADVYLWAAEAIVGGAAGDNSADYYVNQVRDRAGLPAITGVQFMDIVQERRAEFSFESSRWWDMKRWRLAHLVWDGDRNTRTSNQTVLFPFMVYDANTPQFVNGVAQWKWVFQVRNCDMFDQAKKFDPRAYYIPYKQTWLDRNKLAVKNPGQ